MKPGTASSTKSRADRLNDLKNNLPPDQPPPEGGPESPSGTGQGGAEPGESQHQGIVIDPNEAADTIITYADNFCAEAGLSPLNMMQRLLIRMGIVGTVKKYNITLDFDKYPEFALMLGAAWVTVDKVKEYKKLHKDDEEKEPKKEPAPAPAPESAEAGDDKDLARP